MVRVIYESKRFKVLFTGRDFVIKRTDELYNHAHFHKRIDAFRFVKLLEDKKVPHSEYWQIAAKRVLTEEEYAECSDQHIKERMVRVRKNSRKR